MVRIVMVVWLLAACGKDSSKPYVELEKKHGGTVREIAAWVPVVKRTATLPEVVAADHARKQILKAAPTSPGSSSEEPAASLELTLFTLHQSCEDGILPEDRKDRQKQVVRCREAAEIFESKIGRLAEQAREAGAPAESILSMDRPDPAAKKQADAMLAAIEPGPKAKAWMALKQDASASHEALGDACEAAAEEWKAKGDALKKAGAADEGDHTWWVECLAVASASLVLTMVKKCPAERPDCLGLNACDHVKKSMKDLAILPPHYVPPIKAAAAACGSTGADE